MSIKSINSSLNTRLEYAPLQQKKNQNKQAFTGAGSNPIVVVMDAIDRGGFAASFIAQDGIGMVAPRIATGLNRNRKREIDPETGLPTGKKTGPLNWEFARREGIREILSGPSAFIIPGTMMAGIKAFSGSANNVHVSHIKALGETFVNFAETNTDLLTDTAYAKEQFYNRVFKNVLNASLENKLPEEILRKTAKEFAQDYIAVEKAPSKGFWKVFIDKAQAGSKEDLRGALVGKYMDLRKQLLDPSVNELGAVLPVGESGKKVQTNFSRVLSSLTDYSDDVLKNTKNFVDKNGTDEVEKFLKSFNNRRVGTRVMSIASMFSAVVLFYMVIPKLYNLGLKHDPGLAGLEDDMPANGATEQVAQAADEKNVENAQNSSVKVDEKQPQVTENQEENEPSKKVQKDGVAFTGGFQNAARKLGGFIVDSDLAQKAVNKFEFNGASMSVSAMLTLLFGFCLPPRYLNAKSDKERKEVLVRDISSFLAILFGANALSRLTSVGLSKLSGLALNVKPEDHNKSIFHTVKNYLTPGNGIEVLKGSQIDAKYSNLEGYRDRIVGFVDALESQGGSAQKVFRMDKALKESVETILNKPLKDATTDELKAALKAADEELLNGADTPAVKALKKVYAKFAPGNIADYKNRVLGFVEALENQDLKVMEYFNKHRVLRKNAETILGKSLADATPEELKAVLKSADKDLLNGADTAATKALKNIYAKFKPDNKFINIAKTCNSTFGFLSTLVLVPLFMIGVAKYCENMTKKRVAEEKAAREAEALKNQPRHPMFAHIMPNHKPTMTGFLNK